jgi:hypothetical protein
MPNNNSTNNYSWTLFIQPSICVFGLITNSLNIIVFLNKKMKDPSFKYMLCISISDFIYLGLLIFMPFIQNIKSKEADLYKTYIQDYFTSCLSMIGLFSEIVLSIQRYLILTNTIYSVNAKLLIFFLIILSFLYYSPILILNQNNNTFITVVLYVIRIFLGVFVLTFINLINVFKYNKRYELNNNNNSNNNNENIKLRRRNSENNNKKRNNITLMTLWIWIVYSFGTLPYSTIYILSLLVNTKSDIMINTIDLILNLTLSFLLISHSINIFIYFFFNRMYRFVLKSYFK